MNPYDHGPAYRADANQRGLSQVYAQYCETVRQLDAANSLIAAQVRLIGNLTRMAIGYADQRDRARATAVTLEQRVAVLERGDD